ncbi:MAG: sulfite exporter TauE/SafE family protein [Acidimicrobiia bacterium]
MTPWKLMAIGLGAGIFAGGLGVGGGIILVPLLIWAGLDRHRAHATSLAAILLIGVVGAMSFGYSGELRLDVGLTIGLGGVVGSLLGANAMNRMSARSLTIVFGVVLLVAGLRMVSGADPLPGAGDLSTAALVAISIGIGLVAGFFAGIAGVGGGVVIVPAAVFFLGLDQHEAQGTSLVAIVLTALAATWANYRNGRVVPKDGLLAGVGGAVGALLGSRLALGADEDTLAFAFGVLILLVSLRSLYRVIRPFQSISASSG